MNYKPIVILNGEPNSVFSELLAKSLKKFKQFLDQENPDRVCFITGKAIPENDLSIDHIIPWSYMYSDDLWNLVYVNKSINSSMSNRIKKWHASKP